MLEKDSYYKILYKNKNETGYLAISAEAWVEYWNLKIVNFKTIIW